MRWRKPGGNPAEMGHRVRGTLPRPFRRPRSQFDRGSGLRVNRAMVVRRCQPGFCWAQVPSYYCPRCIPRSYLGEVGVITILSFVLVVVMSATAPRMRP